MGIFLEISNLNLALKGNEYLLFLLMTSFMSFNKEKRETQKNLAGEYRPYVQEKYLPFLTSRLTFPNSYSFPVGKYPAAAAHKGKGSFGKVIGAGA